jgi:hypothetical protein
MLDGLDKACQSLVVEWEELRSDLGYAKDATVSKEKLQEMFGQVLVSTEAAWRDQDIDIINTKFLPVYRAYYKKAMESATPGYDRLRDAQEEMQSVVEQLSNDNTRDKRRDRIESTLDSKAPVKKQRLEIELPLRRMFLQQPIL